VVSSDPRGRRAAEVAAASATLAALCAVAVAVAALAASAFGFLVLLLLYGAIFVPAIAGVVLTAYAVRRARREQEVDARLAIAMAMLAPGLLVAAYAGFDAVASENGAGVTGWVAFVGGLAGLAFATSAVTAWLVGRHPAHPQL
jgi:hypothetical protein